MRSNKKFKINAISYALALSAAFVAGALPVALVYGVDPYEMFRGTERLTKTQDIAEKAHYPLWKLAKYKTGASDTIILGDSRARSLRDKYWHELGMDRALNLAYGGGTLPEIYSTFELIKNDNAIKNLVIGIQLRSFDEQHKSGMNRVPEAKTIVDDKFEYLKNWSIFQTAWAMMKIEEKATFDNFETFARKFAISAQAQADNSQPIDNTEQPSSDDICQNCDLPTELLALSNRNQNGVRERFPQPLGTSLSNLFGSEKLQNWSEVSYLYKTSNRLTALPEKMARQVTKNAKSDWAGFNFSTKYWSYLEEISHWAQKNNKNLIFVIPPTIEDMQRTISIHGHDILNHRFHEELAKLAPVIDLDFSNEVTQDINNFSDAYHFKANVAKDIVGQIVSQISSDPAAINRAQKRSNAISCEEIVDPNNTIKLNDRVQLSYGENCRVWRKS